MPRFRLERGPVVCERGELAVSMWTRTKGLLGRSGLERGEGLWIQPTGSIHMWFMRFPIDVVWAGRDGKVLKRYAPTDTPESLAKDVEAALAA